MSARAEYAQAMTGSTVDSSRFVASLGVRPARAAILVPKVKGWSWLAMFEAALASQSRCWGGRGNLIFPMSGDMKDRELFWELADRFDADVFVLHEPTYADIEEVLPAWHRSFVRTQRAAFTKEHGAEVAEDLISQLARLRVIEGRLDPEWLEPIRRRLAPLNSAPHNWMLGRVSGSSEPPVPLMDATAFTELPDRVWAPTTSLGLTAQLLLTAKVGRLTNGTRGALLERGVSIEDEALSRTLAWASAAVDGPHAPVAAGPWDIAGRGLALYRRGPYSLEVSVLVVGDTPWISPCSTPSAE